MVCSAICVFRSDLANRQRHRTLTSTPNRVSPGPHRSRLTARSTIFEHAGLTHREFLKDFHCQNGRNRHGPDRVCVVVDPRPTPSSIFDRLVARVCDGTADAQNRWDCPRWHRCDGVRTWGATTTTASPSADNRETLSWLATSLVPPRCATAGYRGKSCVAVGPLDKRRGWIVAAGTGCWRSDLHRSAVGGFGGLSQLNLTSTTCS
jgi:hypothetical protein